MSLLRVRRSCVLCGSPHISLVLELPATPPANELIQQPASQEIFPLRLQLCDDCGHLQLADVVDPVRLFSNYVYVSGTSPSFVKHFADYAQRVCDYAALNPKSLIVEIGSNDGTLLKAFQQLGYRNVVGIDPARKIAEQANQEGVTTLVEFFDRQVALNLRHQRGAADVIVANNVFAHADDLRAIALGIRDLLSPDGIFVFEVSYLRDVLEQTLFDTIYHEHLSYHAIKPLETFLSSCGLNLFQVERVPTHGGSIRGFATRAKIPQSAAMKQLVQEEITLGLFQTNTYDQLQNRIADYGAKLRQQIMKWKQQGYKICGFGAPAKLTTLMAAFELQGTDFEFIIDDSPWKQGLYTPGLNIPIVSSQYLDNSDVNICIVFAWNFFDAIVAKHYSWVEQGGLFIKPL